MAAGATTATFLWATPYEMAYLLTHAAVGGDSSCNIDGSGAGSPDLATDSAGSTHLNPLMTALYALQADSRAAFGLGIPTVAVTRPMMNVEIENQVATVGATIVDAKVDADVVGPGGRPRLTCHMMDQGTAVLRIKYVHSTGR